VYLWWPILVNKGGGFETNFSIFLSIRSLMTEKFVNFFAKRPLFHQKVRILDKKGQFFNLKPELFLFCDAHMRRVRAKTGEFCQKNRLRRKMVE
jgi:hypothetical protein